MNKIPDPELQRFAETDDADHQCSVIVELSAPPPAPVPEKKRPGPPFPGQGRPNPLELARAGGSEASMDQLERQLATLGLDHDLVRLNMAEAFVVNVTPKQLRAVAQLPLVGVIRPNRTHQVSSSS